MTTFLIGLFFSIVIFGLGMVVIAVGLQYLDTSKTWTRIQTFVVDENHDLRPRTLAEIQRREISGTLFQRTILSWLNAIITFLSRFTPEQTDQELQRRLTIAGNPFNLRSPQFYGIRVLFMFLGALTAFLIFRVNSSMLYLLLALLVLLAFIILPDIWLNGVMRQRQETIRRGLPDALDMLSVCVSAGLSFDQALLRIGQTFKTPIGMELARVVSEVEVGISRRQALRNLQARVDITELSSFIALILQSEAMGMSIADVLSSQAEQMRVYRQYRAKEIAQQLPAKMMIPLVLFIFPALWAVILGPMLPSFAALLK
jgi:tight adherence protein C